MLLFRVCDHFLATIPTRIWTYDIAAQRTSTKDSYYDRRTTTVKTKESSSKGLNRIISETAIAQADEPKIIIPFKRLDFV